jgi:hypothetical protein
MASSRPRPSGAPVRRATSRTTTTRRVATEEVDVVDEPGGMDLDAGIGIVTCLLLVIALVLVDYEMGKHMAAGILFK